LYEKSMLVARQMDLLYSQIEINDSITYVFFLNNYGILHASIGDISSALKYLIKAKPINDKLFGNDHPEKAQLLNNIASIYKDMGQYAQAEKLYHEVLRIDEEFYGEHHFRVARDLNNLAVLYMSYGNLIQAEKKLILVLLY